MGKSQLGDRPVIQTDKRYGQISQCAANINCRQAGIHDQVGRFAIVDPRENAVTAPILEPRGRPLVQAVRFEIDRPRPMFLLITGDSPQQPAAILARRFDKQSNVRETRHETTGNSR